MPEAPIAPQTASRTKLSYEVSYTVLAVMLILSSSLWIIAGGHLGELYRHTPRILSSQMYPGDFLYPWYGSRELIVHHRDPYSDDVTREIRNYVNVGKHGITDPNWGQFIYPVYVGFLLLPTLWMPFHVAQLVFFALLLAAAVINIMLWLRFTDLRLSFPTMAIVIACTLLSPPFLQGLMLRQVGILVAMLISAGAVLLVRRKYLPAGVALALATVKPQMVLLLLLWLFIWTVADWKNRKGLIYGFSTTLAGLISAAELLRPGWITAWMHAMGSARNYGNTSILELLLGSTMGLAASICFVGLLGLILLKVTKKPTAEHFALGFSFVLLLQLLVLPLLAGFNLVLALPAVLLLVRHFLRGTIRDQTGQQTGAVAGVL
jgi:hypothetical protein